MINVADTKTEKYFTITQYAKLFKVDRRTIYNWLKDDTKNLEVVGRKGKQYIKVSVPEMEGNPHLPIIVNEKAIQDLSVADLASLCTMYKLTQSPDSFRKLTMISTELNKRLTNIFI